MVSLQVLLSSSGRCLQQRKQLVALILQYASALRIDQEVAHLAVSPISGACLTCSLCRNLPALRDGKALHIEGLTQAKMSSQKTLCNMPRFL